MFQLFSFLFVFILSIPPLALHLHLPYIYEINTNLGINRSYFSHNPKICKKVQIPKLEVEL